MGGGGGGGVKTLLNLVFENNSSKSELKQRAAVSQLQRQYKCTVAAVLAPVWCVYLLKGKGKGRDLSGRIFTIFLEKKMKNCEIFDKRNLSLENKYFRGNTVVI